MVATSLTEAQFSQVEAAAPWLADACKTLLRQQPDALDAVLRTFCTNSTLKATKTSIHCHYLAFDGNGRPRIGGLASALYTRLVDYCIPRSEFNAARQALIDRNSSVEWVKLQRKAQDLFTQLVQSGEGGELLLYLLIESILRVPQFLCKMPLKTSGAVHYQGADGIHGTVDAETGRLALYWGEAKLHADLNQALRECFKSMVPYLLDTDSSTSTQARDLHLLRDNLDLSDPRLEEAIRHFLDPDHPHYNKMEFRAACLVGFDSKAYPELPNPDVEAQVRVEIESALDEWRTKIHKHIATHKIAAFQVEVFCLPFPSVSAFRESFRKELRVPDAKS